MRNPLRARPRRSALLAAPVLAVALLTACGGGESGAEPSPTEALAEAKVRFDSAESVRMQLTTEAVPDSGNGVLGAQGLLTQQPAFEGEVRVILNNFTADVPVVAVDQQVYAQLALLGTGWNVIDPAEYGAPDPALFADPQQGLSTLLTDMQDVTVGEQTRDGQLILITYLGELPGTAVQRIIPSADDTASYPTVVGVTSDGLPARVEITGPFFAGGADVTYEVAFSDFDAGDTVQAPTS